MDDVVLDSIEGKGCQSIEASKSHTGSNEFYLPSKSYPISNFKDESDCRDLRRLDATSEISLVAQKDLFYMDKAVTDVKQRQLSVLMSASTVKDICIDEGKQITEKVLIGYDKVDDEIFPYLKIPGVNDSSILMEETKEKENLEGLKSLSTSGGIYSLAEILQRDGNRECSHPSKCAMNLNEIGDETVKTDLGLFLSNKYPVEQLYSGSSISKRKQLDATERTACISSEEMTEPTPHFIEEFKSDFSQVDSSSHIATTAEFQDLRQQVDQAAEVEDLINMVSDSKDIFEEEKTFAFSESVPNRIDDAKVSSDHVKLLGVASTSDLEAGDTSIVGNKDKVMYNQLRMQYQNDVGNVETICEGIIDARTSFVHLVDGGSNLLDVPSFSGSITATHVPYSGSISFQSESSTTSGHSFAFPVLQPEWGNSPVRMAKASRRHLRKQRWKSKLVCCKF